MNKIKFLKPNITTGLQKIQLNGITYKPYTICSLADTKFGTDEINSWFNSANSQELLAKAIENCKRLDKDNNNLRDIL